MTGPRSKRKAEAPRASNRSAQPARRSKCVPPPAAPRPQCEVPAAGMVRPPSPVHTMENMHMDLTHRLRSGRNVFVPNTEKPGPMKFKKGERALPDLSWQTPACAKVGLEHYNLMNEEDEHELVKPIERIVFFSNGPWMHANFLAKSKRGTTRADLLPKYFFAELKIVPGEKRKLSCVSCIKMDPVNRKTAPVRGCRTCPSRMLHPAAGGYQGGPIQHPSASEDRAVSTSIVDSMSCA